MHSKATTISVLIRNKSMEEKNKAEKKLLIFIVDNGLGFEVKEQIKKTNHFGLENMKERANLLGGTLDVIS